MTYQQMPENLDVERVFFCFRRIGMTNQAIANALKLSKSTVENYFSGRGTKCPTYMVVSRAWNYALNLVKKKMLSEKELQECLC